MRFRDSESADRVSNFNFVDMCLFFSQLGRAISLWRHAMRIKFRMNNNTLPTHILHILDSHSDVMMLIAYISRIFFCLFTHQKRSHIMIKCVYRSKRRQKKYRSIRCASMSSGGSFAFTARECRKFLIFEFFVFEIFILISRVGVIFMRIGVSEKWQRRCESRWMKEFEFKWLFLCSKKF